MHNLICSKAVPEVIRELGGTPIRSRVGHSFIKQVMAETGAVFGGEHSAHYYFRDNFRADSGIIAALMVLEQLSITGLAALGAAQAVRAVRDVGRDQHPRRRPRGSDRAHRRRVLRRRSRTGSTASPSISATGGSTCAPSNTEPLLRLNLEAADRDACDEHTAEVLAVVRGTTS